MVLCRQAGVVGVGARVGACGRNALCAAGSELFQVLGPLVHEVAERAARSACSIQARHFRADGLSGPARVALGCPAATHCLELSPPCGCAGRERHRTLDVVWRLGAQVGEVGARPGDDRRVLGPPMRAYFESLASISRRGAGVRAVWLRNASPARLSAFVIAAPLLPASRSARVCWLPPCCRQPRMASGKVLGRPAWRQLRVVALCADSDAVDFLCCRASAEGDGA